MKQKLTAWLQDVVNFGGNDKDTSGWVTVHHLKLLENGGLSCVINDGSHKMCAVISAEAFSEFKKKWNLTCLGPLGRRIYCKKSEIRSLQENCFTPYLHINSFDSLGECGSTEVFDNLEYVTPSKSWKLKCFEEAVQKFNTVRDNEYLYSLNDAVVSEINDWGESPMLCPPKNYDKITKTDLFVNNDSSSQISWGETPVCVSEGDRLSQEIVSQEATSINVGNELDGEKAGMDNMPHSSSAANQIDLHMEQNCEKNIAIEQSSAKEKVNCIVNTLPGSSKLIMEDDIKKIHVHEEPHFTMTKRVIGCKHDPVKICYVCLIRTKTTVPKSLHEAAKRIDFKCIHGKS